MHILFDFDGTLFDSYPSIVENIYSEISEERKHIISKEEVYKLIKINAKTAMDMLEFDAQQRANVYSRQYDVTPELNQPFSHIEKVLQYSKKNVIMSHKSESAVREILAYYNMTHYFAEIVAKGNMHFERKPNSSSYRYLFDKHHIDLVIGDRQIDLLPAKELGIATCSYQNHLPAADYYIDDYSNFPLVALGLQFDVKSHSKKQPELSLEWLSHYFDKNSKEFRTIKEVVDKVEDEEIAEVAFLHKIGLSPLATRTGCYPLDSALFALEHGFRASTVKCILLHNGYRGNGVDDKYEAIYHMFESFMTEYVEEKIEAFNTYL